jgi:hypothetical protein
MMTGRRQRLDWSAVLRRRRTDPLGRQMALALGAARVALGVGALFATRPTLKAMGFAETDASGRALAKLAGGRDLGLGLFTLASRNDPAALRTVVLAAALLDAADALALGLAATDPDARRAGLGGVVFGGGAALAGLWAWRRIGDT